MSAGDFCFNLFSILREVTFEHVKLASVLLVFGNRDETLALVFEIVLPAQHSENYFQRDTFRNANSAVAQNKTAFFFSLNSSISNLHFRIDH